MYVTNSFNTAFKEAALGESRITIPYIELELVFMKSNRLLKPMERFLLLRKRLKISFSSVSIWMDDWTGALSYCNTYNSVDRRNLVIERSIKASVESSF